MPCSDPGGPIYSETASNRRANRIQAKLDTTTALLCHLCRVHIAHGHTLDEEVSTWYAKHKAADDERIERELEEVAKLREKERLAAIKERVLSQLTPEERLALTS